MPKNIKSIDLVEVDKNKPRVVTINFEFPCTWTILDIEDLKDILRLWIKGEEEKYPQEKGFRGRWMLFEEIEKIFNK